jgi:hypothetical protein
MIEMFTEWYNARHEYAKEWKKKTGGKVLGYFCTYVPEEILYAANVLPVRILGSHEPQNVTGAATLNFLWMSNGTTATLSIGCLLSLSPSALSQTEGSLSSN